MPATVPSYVCVCVCLYVRTYVCVCVYLHAYMHMSEDCGGSCRYVDGALGHVAHTLLFGLLLLFVLNYQYY
jgi:hypothetical protein